MVKNRFLKKVLCIALVLGQISLSACSGAVDTESAFEETVAEVEESTVSTSDSVELSGEASMEMDSADELQKAEEIEEVQESEELEEVKSHAPVHGIYLSANVAGSSGMMEDLLAHLDESGINAVVIDVKNDEGRVTWETSTPMVEELGSTQILIRDMPGLVETLHEHGIYVIGRCVAFREMYLNNVKPQWLVKNTDGSVYKDKKGFGWIDPTNEEAWDYLAEISKACAEVGFDEIQFDYVRYGTGIKEEMIGLDGAGKQEAVTTYASHMKEVFEALKIPFSLDVFGTVIHSDIDRDIVGQDYASLSRHANYLSPMVYPSHYYDGSYGIAHPDEKPYEIITGALGESNMVLESVGEEKRAGVRPWLQAFTASYLSHYIKYGGEQIRAQILATYEAGYDEWLLWNPSCKYPWEELTEEKLPQFEEVQLRMEELRLQEQEAQTVQEVETEQEQPDQLE